MEDLREFFFNSEYEFKFEWINKTAYGDIDPAEELVRINVRLMLLETMLHEYYHYTYPSASELEVELRTRAKVQAMSVSEIFQLTNEFVATWGGKSGA